jgi:UMF1 family MFS transporter
MLRPVEIRKLRNTFWYLGAWFLLSDGESFSTCLCETADFFLAFTTITTTAVLFAKTTLELPPSSLIIVGLLTPTAGILGSLIWPKIQRALKLSNKAILMILVMLASFVPLYGCLGFLPSLKGRVGGLVTAGEMYALAVYFGEPERTYFNRICAHVPSQARFSVLSRHFLVLYFQN